jgi:hypothetical protein
MLLLILGQPSAHSSGDCPDRSLPGSDRQQLSQPGLQEETLGFARCLEPGNGDENRGWRE